jgi:hypothetical protein
VAAEKVPELLDSIIQLQLIKPYKIITELGCITENVVSCEELNTAAFIFM